MKGKNKDFKPLAEEIKDVLFKDDNKSEPSDFLKDYIKDIICPINDMVENHIDHDFEEKDM